MTPALVLSLAEVSLLARLRETDLLVASLEILDGDCDPDLRERLEAELRIAITGTRSNIDRTAATLARFEQEELEAGLAMEAAAARIATLARQRKRLEADMIDALVRTGVSSLSGHNSTLAVEECRPRVVIEDATRIPARFLRGSGTGTAPDKRAIAAVIRGGTPVAGCRIAQTLKLVRS